MLMFLKSIFHQVGHCYTFFQFCKCGFPKFFEHVCNSYFEAIVQSNFWALSPIFYPTGDSFHQVLFYPLYASQFPVPLHVKISLTNIATWYHDSSLPSPSVIVRVVAFVCSVTSMINTLETVFSEVHGCFCLLHFLFVCFLLLFFEDWPPRCHI